MGQGPAPGRRDDRALPRRGARPRPGRGRPRRRRARRRRRLARCCCATTARGSSPTCSPTRSATRATGTRCSPQAAATIARVADLFAEHWPTSAELWMPDGAPPAAGTMVRNPAYAAVLDGLVARVVHACATTDRSAAPRASTRRGASGRPGLVAHAAAAFLAAPHRHSDGGDHAGVITADDFAAFDAGLRGRRRRASSAGTRSRRPARGRRDPRSCRRCGILEPLPDDLLDPSHRGGRAHDPRGAEARARRPRRVLRRRRRRPRRAALGRVRSTQRRALIGDDGVARVAPGRARRARSRSARRCAPPAGVAPPAPASRPARSNRRGRRDPRRHLPHRRRRPLGQHHRRHAVRRLAAVLADDPRARLLPRHAAADDVARCRVTRRRCDPGARPRTTLTPDARAARRRAVDARSAHPAAISRTSGSCRCCCACSSAATPPQQAIDAPVAAHDRAGGLVLAAHLDPRRRRRRGPARRRRHRRARAARPRRDARRRLVARPGLGGRARCRDRAASGPRRTRAGCRATPRAADRARRASGARAHPVRDERRESGADLVGGALATLHLERVAAALDPRDRRVLAGCDGLLELRVRVDERVVRALDEQLRLRDVRQVRDARLRRVAGRMQRIAEVDEPGRGRSRPPRPPSTPCGRRTTCPTPTPARRRERSRAKRTTAAHVATACAAGPGIRRPASSTGS